MEVHSVCYHYYYYYYYYNYHYYCCYFRSGGSVVANTIDYQSRDRKIDLPLLRFISDKTLNRGPVSV